MKVSELTDLKQIDYLTLRVLRKSENPPVGFESDSAGNVYVDGEIYSPSSGNAQTYELQIKFKINIYHDTGGGIYTRAAFSPDAPSTDDTDEAIAICKAVIASEWGDTIPDDVREQIR